MGNQAGEGYAVLWIPVYPEYAPRGRDTRNKSISLGEGVRERERGSGKGVIAVIQRMTRDAIFQSGGVLGGAVNTLIVIRCIRMRRLYTGCTPS